MADDVTYSGTGVSPPAGFKQVTDEHATRGHMPLFKLAYSADGDATPVGADVNGVDVDVVRLPALVAGSANIGDVDVLTVPADPFGVNADAASATGSISAKLRFIAATGIPVTSLPNVTLAAGTNTNEIVGDVDHNVAIAGNPVTIGGRASAAAPTDVGADDRAVRAWMLRNGAQCVVLTAAGALIAGDAANGLDVDVTRMAALVASSANIGDVDVLTLPALVAGTANIGDVDVLTMPAVAIAGTVAHDGSTANNPVTTGGRAIAHGANPTAVAAADVTDSLHNRAGVQFTIGGHPNAVTVKHTTITTAVTDVAVVTVAGGLKIVVTSFQFTLDNASTVFPTVLLGFGAVNTPTTTGVIGAHGGVPAGGGFGRGDGSGIIGVGADGEDLRVTTTGNATGNGLQLVVTYFTIES